MRILVTGAAGFIGSHLVDRFVRDGHEVVGVDNFITGRRENIAHLEGESRFRFVEADICEGLQDEGPSGGIDAICQLASPASPVDYYKLPLETLRVGAEGTRNVLELARSRRSKVLLASTSEVYGDPEVHPQREDYWGNVNPIGPRSVYDEAKRYAEALATAYAREGLVEVRIARIFNTYGPRMRLSDGRVLPAFGCAAIRGELLPVFGDGSQTRSFCYVSDLVEGLVGLLESDLRGPVNLGNPEEITILDLAHEVIEITGSASRIDYRQLPQDDPRRRRPDIARARKELGWEPKVPRREGLARTLEDFRLRLAEGSG